ncbi:hypothetical protein BDV95DRAFT_495297, partial [Massariosphaeria phaeospora]
RERSPRRAPLDARHVIPSLPKHHTAPTTTGLVTQREGAAKMFQSFAADGGFGDTQPDSQMVKNFTSGMMETAPDLAPKPMSLLAPAEDDADDSQSDGVEAVGSSQEQPCPTITSPTVILEDDLETQLRGEPPPTSPLKFETPAMAGRKRDSQGQVLSSAMRTSTTPGTILSASAFFGNGTANAGPAPAMSLTQAFNATQARTSPVVGGPNEDVVFQRPSPNFNNARNSSPPPAFSSPIKPTRSEVHLRSSSEPRAEYVTMKQSQEKRQREDQDKEGVTTVAAQDSWEQPTAEERRALLRKKFDQDAARSLRKSDTVMDSQPGPVDNTDSIPQPKSLRFPSSPSTNQYSINQTTILSKTGFTSQLSSSSIPAGPPDSSSPLQEPLAKEGEESEERVPSSPPIITHEDDITYDEHAYDELSVSQRESNLGPGTGDVDMEDREDVAVTNEEAFEDEELQEGDPAETEDDPDGDDDLPKKASADAEADEMDLEAPPAEEADLVGDYEVPETLEQENEHPSEHEHELIRSSHPEDEVASSEQHATVQPRVQRQSTIPESDMLDDTQPSFFPYRIDAGNADSHATESNEDNSVVPNQTNSTEPFHTARENHSGSQPDELSNDAARISDAETTEQVPVFRSLRDIANQPDIQHSQDLGDIEIPRLSYATEEDDAFLGSSPMPPPAKKRRVTYSAKKKHFAGPIADTDPLSDQVSTSPLQQVHNAPQDSSPLSSAKEMEEQGASAAANARGEAEAIYTKVSKLRGTSLLTPARPQAQKPGALKSVNVKALLASPRKAPPVFPKSKPSPPSRSRRINEQRASELPDVQSPSDEPDELAGPTPEVTAPGSTVRPASDHGEAPTGGILVPNRVFAYWPGRIVYYAATCIGRADNSQWQVRYDDGNIHPLEPLQVRNLDLRVGDHVKVDQKGMKKHTYLVVGLQGKLDADHGLEYPLTDRRGYTVAIVQEKPRDSLPKDAVLQPKPPVSVPITQIYLTNGMWARYRDRMFDYTPAPSSSAPASRLATPVRVMGETGTPSFSKRTSGVPSLLKESTSRPSHTSTAIVPAGNVFSNMAFAISLSEDSDGKEKEAITKLITSNGGRIVDTGFHELFDYEPSDRPSTPKTFNQATSSAGDLVLYDENRDLGFVALISDTHSRRTKYFQALALNIPCLHIRWIQDTIAASRLLPFFKYFLPAGISTFLGPGVVRSRTMDVYDPTAADVSFANMIQGRNLLLHNHTVLIVTGKTKPNIERKQPYIFLMHTLGPAAIGQCADLAAARAMLHEDDWGWVYVNGGVEDVADAEAVLFHGAAAKKAGARSKKRKREEKDAAVGPLVRTGWVDGKEVRVMGDEFVVQSLILAALVEE